MKLFISLVVMCFCFQTLAFSSEQSFEGESKEPLKFPNTLKISTVEGAQVANICSKVMQVAYGRLGIDLNIIPMPGKTAISRSNNGVMDAELFRVDGMDKKFENLIKVPVVINSDYGVIISKKENLIINGWDSIKDFYIGIKRGVVFAKNGTKDMKVIESENFQNLIKMLENDRIDVVVISQISALGYFAKNKTENIVINQPAIQKTDLYHYLHKDHINLLEPLTNVLQQMTDSGEIEAIRQQYIQDLSNL